MIKNALKEEGKIFTPLNIVNVLLDVAKYVGAERILEHPFYGQQRRRRKHSRCSYFQILR